MLHLKYGEKSKAKEIALQSVNEGNNQVLPLAVYVHVLESIGELAESEKQFSVLQKKSALIDMEFAPFQGFILLPIVWVN